jgi:hypothetical protein
MGFAFGYVGEAQDTAFVSGDEPAQNGGCSAPLFPSRPQDFAVGVEHDPGDRSVAHGAGQDGLWDELSVGECGVVYRKTGSTESR